MKATPEKIYERIIKKMLKLEKSKDILVNKEKVRLDNNNYFSIECVREHDIENEFYGRPRYFEVYLIRKDADFDCCTCYGMVKDDRDYGLKEFVNMYA